MRALCLSAGGMFGAYQAGVWAELHKEWQPDLVVGTSIGALNGYLIASGVDPDQLMEHWRTLDFLRDLRLRVPMPPWRGVVDAGAIEHTIERICGPLKPRMPVGVVTTQWSGLKPRLFQDEEITWRHLAASCAVPLVLAQQRIEGKWHADGGLLCAAPLWAAVKMGATEIIAVNVLPKMPLMIRLPARLASKMSGHRPRMPSPVRVIRMRPEPDLGSWKDASLWERFRNEGYIERGRYDARMLIESAALPAHAALG